MNEQPSPTRHATFFSTPELTQRLQLVEHLLKNTEIVAVLIAEKGGGKTHFLRALENDITDSIVIRLNGNQHTLPEMLLQHLGKLLQMADKQHSYADIKQRIARLYQQETRITILIDNADLLPPASLLQVIRLSQDETRQSAANLVLTGTIELQNILTDAKTKVITGDIFQIMEIPRLSFEQARQYSKALLGAEQLSEHALFETIYAQSKGLPAKLNKLIKQQLEISGLESKSKQHHGSIKRILLVMLLAIPLVGALLFQDKINALFNPVKEPTLIIHKETVSDAKPIGEPKAPPPEIKNNNIDDDYVVNLYHYMNDLEAEAANMAALAQKPPVAPMPEITPFPLKELTDTLSSSEQEDKHNTVNVTSKQIITNAMAELARLNEVTDSNNQEMPTETTKAPSSPTKQTEIKPSVAKPTPTNVQTISWINAAPKTAWTLQIMATSQSPDITRVAKSNHVAAEDLHAVKTLRKNAAWYITLHKHYPDKNAAITARSKLPKRLQKAWPRSLQSIRASMSK